MNSTHVETRGWHVESAIQIQILESDRLVSQDVMWNLMLGIVIYFLEDCISVKLQEKGCVEENQGMGL